MMTPERLLNPAPKGYAAPRGGIRNLAGEYLAMALMFAVCFYMLVR